MGWDVESFRLISYRALMMMARLTEKAGTSHALDRGFTNGAAVLDKAVSENGGEDVTQAVLSDEWDGAPYGHAVIGALMLPNCDKTSLSLLCKLHAMAMRES
jgi:SWI/SNF chromatin-remodeling complex subunit SWI1